MRTACGCPPRHVVVFLDDGVERARLLHERIALEIAKVFLPVREYLPVRCGLPGKHMECLFV